ncbi:ubiquitin fusion degradation protein UFD1-domain-containing protein [Spinellus fusiger]|nr:ubiquitin fusion degradation protein UFD1-domain-containing protein [Spinellus fusiger]
MNPNRVFSELYRCYPIAMMQHGSDRDNVNYGGKIILPQSALEKLSQLNVSYPMLFHLNNASKDKHTHAGVLEFIAEEGRAYFPQWMMETLQVEPGNLIEVKNINLPLGSFVKIQPQSTDFLDISDHRAVLENALRNFATLTAGDTIQINYNNKVYEIKVLQVKPDHEDHGGISIVETDLEVDFAPPVGYVEPTRTKTSSSISHMMIHLPDAPKAAQFAAFSGGGQSLRSKGKEPVKAETSTDATAQIVSETQPFDPNDEGPLNLPFGQLYFGYQVIPPKSQEKEEKTQVFTGAGQTLRNKKNTLHGK